MRKSVGMGILTVFVMLSANAGTDIAGVVCETNDNRIGLQPLKASSCYAVYFINNVAQDDFMPLEVGDGAIVSGTVSTKPNEITIESVETVGLQRLLGLWKDKSLGRAYRFDSYVNLLVYDPAKGYPERFTTYDFELFPDSSKKWMMLLSGPSTVNTGSLKEIKKRPATYEICIFEKADSKSKKDCATITRASN